METIKNYLDTMFANLPSTPAVLKAKEVLWEMMEDKYNELLSEGRTENEAVGTVISEFGNLSELADALGLEDEMNAAERKLSDKNKTDRSADDSAKNEENAKESDASSDNASESNSENASSAETGAAKQSSGSIRIITASEAEELLKKRSESAFKISLGIAICILSLVGFVLGDVLLDERFEFIGVLISLAIAGAGVATIVFGAMAEGEWKGISAANSTLSMDATKYVANESSSYSRDHSLKLTIGILLVVLCWIPTFIFSEILPKFEDASAIVLFITLAFGVMLIVNSGMRKNGYESLLALNGKGTMKAEYRPEDEKNVKYISPVAEFFMSVYWPVFTCLYLILSFTTFKWGLTWIIWPVVGILHRPLKRALTVREQ